MNTSTAAPYTLEIAPISQRGQVLFIARSPNDGKLRPTASLQMDKALARWIVGQVGAVPDLMAALDSLLEWMQDAESELGGPLPVKYAANVQKPVVIEKVRAALAKARGQ